MSGLEVLGIAASVIQIADVGARLSVKLFTFTRRVKDAKASVQLLSSEIAATGSALRELGHVLEDDEVASVGSHQAVATVQQLVADCWQVFGDIEDSVGKGMSRKDRPEPLINSDAVSKNRALQKPASFNLRQRLRYPFVEDQIQLLKTKLECLKSSLVLMLQVMSIAIQIRQKPKTVVSYDQTALIQTLISDKQLQEQRFNLLIKSLENVSVTGEHSKSNGVKNNLYLSAMAVPTASNRHRLTSSQLPQKLQVHRTDIEQHALMAHTLLRETDHGRYRVNHGIRYRMQQAILKGHWDEWSSLANKCGRQAILDLVDHHEAVTKYWVDAMCDDGDDEREVIRPPGTSSPRSRFASRSSKVRSAFLRGDDGDIDGRPEFSFTPMARKIMEDESDTDASSTFDALDEDGSPISSQPAGIIDTEEESLIRPYPGVEKSQPEPAQAFKLKQVDPIMTYSARRSPDTEEDPTSRPSHAMLIPRIPSVSNKSRKRTESMAVSISVPDADRTDTQYIRKRSRSQSMSQNLSQNSEVRTPEDEIYINGIPIYWSGSSFVCYDRPIESIAGPLKRLLSEWTTLTSDELSSL